MKQNHEIRFPSTQEQQEELDNFIKEYFKGVQKTKVYSFIFEQGMESIKEKLFKGKVPIISFK